MGTVLRLSLLLLVVLAMASVVVGCGDDDGEENGGSGDGGNGDPGPVSYQDDVQPIFDNSCTVCHGSSGGLSLDSYADLMAGGNSGDAVVAEDADNSLLVQVIEGTVTPQMPPGGSLSDSDISTIREWIDDGALDN